MQEKPFDIITEGGWRLVRQAVGRAGVPDQQDGHRAVIVEQAAVDHLVPRRAPGGGVLAEQFLHQLLPPRTVPSAGEQPTVQQHADLRRGARGIGDLVLGEIPEPVGDPHETEQQPPAPDRHAQPLPQLQRWILRHITWPGQPGDLFVPYVLRPGPAVQQRPDARRVRIAEVLARGDQPQIAIIDKDRTSETSGQPVRQCLNLLDAHSSPSGDEY